MKVVLFSGGLGLRLRDYSERIPKPMALIGPRPVLWHLMKYYAHYGHNEFIICLGHGAEVVKQYFLDYDETVSNDFVLTSAGREVRLLSSDIDEWKITFLDTGINSNVGQRLTAVRSHLEGEEMFLANYSDGLTDLPLPVLVDWAVASGRIATFLAVHSTQSLHVSKIAEDGRVESITPLSESGFWINGGFFVFKQEIFDYINEGEDLVAEPFDRLTALGQLGAYRYGGYWAAMDTFKDRQALEDLYHRGNAPWEVWKRDPEAAAHGTGAPWGLSGRE
jgi:glucose-1-phosphate cytidylyltransferase